MERDLENTMDHGKRPSWAPLFVFQELLLHLPRLICLISFCGDGVFSPVTSHFIFFQKVCTKESQALCSSFRLWFTWSGFELKHWKWSHTYTTPTGVCGWLGKPNHILSHISTSTKIMNYSLSTKTNVFKKIQSEWVEWYTEP